jgi:hypothetical protein
MILYIDTLAKDKTQAAMTALATYTATTDLEQLVLGDSEPLVLHFLTAASTYASWVNDASYTVTVGLGDQEADSAKLYTSTSSFTPSATSRTGRLSINTTDLRDAISAAVYGTTRKGVLMVLQIRVTDPSGNIETLALLSVYVQNRVLSNSATDSEVTVGAVRPIPTVSSLTGGGSTALDGVTTANNSTVTNTVVLLSYSRLAQWWQLVDGTDAEDVAGAPAIVRPDDYDASTNARVWVQIG